MSSSAAAIVVTEPELGPAPTAIVVPIRSFDLAKSRLSGVLAAGERADLARALAHRVITAADRVPAWVVSDDDEVATWAAERGAGLLRPGVRGLNPSITAARDALRDRDVARIVIAHADLPAAGDFASARGQDDEVVIVPDRTGDGTNVMSVPTTAVFTFRYGPLSAVRHVVEARVRRLPVRVVRDDDLAWDIDHPSDLPSDWHQLLEREDSP